MEARLDWGAKRWAEILTWQDRQQDLLPSLSIAVASQRLRSLTPPPEKPFHLGFIRNGCRRRRGRDIANIARVRLNQREGSARCFKA